MQKKALLSVVSMLVLSTLSHAAAKVPAKAPTAKPNIVLFFVDDWGWADLGYRNPKFETPQMDQLISESIDFEQTYIPTPTCSPSRASLATGKHPARLKMVRHIPHGPKYGGDDFGRTEEKFHQWPKDPAKFPSINWLDLEHTTYAEALKELGYYNLFVGKWHLGHEPFHPIHQGFDQQIGTTNWGAPKKTYYPPYFKKPTVFEDEKERYLTDKLTDETVEFIANYDSAEPFMISFWYYNVHSPFVGRKDLVAHYEAKGLSGKDAQYAAMVTAVDHSIGRVRDALKAASLEENTIIMLLSDQGGAFQNGPLQGGKYSNTLYEGGARVPFFVNWPGVTEQGVINKSIIQSADLFPTLVDIAGGDPSNYAELDGVSLLSVFKNNSTLDRGEPIYGYRAYEDLYVSVREGDWKLLAHRSGTLKLFNIAQDIGETNDLAQSHPEKVQKLLKKLKVWEQEMDVVKYSGVQ